MRKALTRYVSWVASSPITATFFAIVLGLLVGAVVIMATTSSVILAWRHLFSSWGAPGHALKVSADTVGAAYRSMVLGSFGNPHSYWTMVTSGHNWQSALTPLSETLTYAFPLVIVAMGVGIAFQTGIFNIGANGQAIMGGIAGTVAGSMIHVPAVIHIPLVLLFAIGGGVITGLIPGLLKTFTGAHEVIVTLMLNYVVQAFLLYVLLSTPLQLPNQPNDVSRFLDSSAQLAPLFGHASGLRVSWAIVIAGLVVAFGWWFVERSSLGFEFRITGANPNAARTAGINPRKIVILVFVVSGGLAGLAGYVAEASTTYNLSGGFLVGSANIGFTAITVSLLGRNRPLGIVLGSLLFAALDVGGRTMQAQTGIPLDLATIVQAAVVLFVATPLLVKEIFHLRDTGSTRIALATQGWSS
jgi:general nucleoside transport system permease protein